MQLDLLALKAKKSISQLLARNNGTENASSSRGYTSIDKAAAKLKTPDPSPSKTFIRSNAKYSPPSNENTSRCNGLMGSLRKNKLRSINSLRSLRSPTKAKRPDTNTTPSANSPCTPTHRQKSSLVLNFEQSPADEPIFDLNCEDSTRFNQEIYYSSPVPIHSSENQKTQSFAACSAILDGTIPPSPAPIRKMLDLEQAEDFLSPTFSPAYDVEEACRELLAPIQDVQELNQIENAQLGMPGVIQAGTEHCRDPSQGTEGEPLIAEDMAKLVNDSQYLWQESEVNKITEQFERQCLRVDKSKVGTPDNLLMILSKNYLLRIFHKGDFKCRVGITVYHAHDYASENESELIVARRDEDLAAAEKIMPDINEFVMLNKDVFGKEETEIELDEALAEGLLPEWLDLDLDMESTAKFRSRTINPAKVQKRESTWGQHAGLYDGTGYGAGSSSRSSTATENATDAVCRCVENGDSEEEVNKMLPGAYPDTSRFRLMPD
ncbi:hypothetical protein yc1106_01034 [Curvularia clavata]|uniref:Uncharacterized protein n=1 Tax=Curvularia clavata TaxID=95742 RepID=A0A9Q8Z241_CURCL|nr:hypothetical protein yc1106_01034 [Curvularia clavata]